MTIFKWKSKWWRWKIILIWYIMWSRGRKQYVDVINLLEIRKQEEKIRITKWRKCSLRAINHVRFLLLSHHHVVLSCRASRQTNTVKWERHEMTLPKLLLSFRSTAWFNDQQYDRKIHKTMNVFLSTWRPPKSKGWGVAVEFNT